MSYLDWNNNCFWIKKSVITTSYINPGKLGLSRLIPLSTVNLLILDGGFLSTTSGARHKHNIWLYRSGLDPLSVTNLCSGKMTSNSNFYLIIFYSKYTTFVISVSGSSRTADYFESVIA